MFEPSVTVYHLYYIRLCWSYISQHIFIHWKCRFSLYHILFILNLPLFSFCVRSTCLLCVIYIRYVMMWEIQWKYIYTGVCFTNWNHYIIPIFVIIKKDGYKLVIYKEKYSHQLLTANSLIPCVFFLLSFLC